MPRRSPTIFLAAAIASFSWSAVADDGELAKFDARVQDEDRQHWAFRPVQRPTVSEVRNRSWARSPIDAFILAPLEAKGWTPAPEVSPRVWLRRVTLDLIGLPPSLKEMEAFLRDTSDTARARIVDELLARPAYGERWARHWLDLARFAETNGYELDATKPNAWKYRDWVIKAFNADMPYERFVTEQLAGDEVPGSDADTLIAAGFLRLGPLDAEPADPAQDRFDQLDDMIVTTSEVFLGLTLGCARCHNHKFEPLSILDYYRMVAVFAPLQRPREGRIELDLPLGTQEQIAAEARRDRDIAGKRRQVEKLMESFREELIRSGKLPLAEDVKKAFLTKRFRRDDAQKQLVETNQPRVDAEVLKAMPVESAHEVAQHEREIRQLRERWPDLPRGYLLRESSNRPSETHLLLRGQAATPGPVVIPGMPAVLVATQPAFPEPGKHTTGRRLALARWIVDPRNPLAARVIVNRVWQYHFGEGLVRSPSDFGVMGDPPTHPELLDWLADWFVHEGGWSLKRLHRLILSSSVARMSKQPDPAHLDEDPDNRLLSHLPYRRLEVEQIRDAMLAMSGQLNLTMYGPSVYPEIPREALEGHSDPDKVWMPFDEATASRRTIYAFVKRSLVVPMLEVLDFADCTRTTSKRSVTSIAPQALTLLNGEFVNRQARHLAARVEREAGSAPPDQIDRLFELALVRQPTEAERMRLSAFLRDEARNQVEESLVRGHPLDEAAARRIALEHVARVVFNLNEFVYTD